MMDGGTPLDNHQSECHLIRHSSSSTSSSLANFHFFIISCLPFVFHHHVIAWNCSRSIQVPQFLSLVFSPSSLLSSDDAWCASSFRSIHQGLMIRLGQSRGASPGSVQVPLPQSRTCGLQGKENPDLAETELMPGDNSRNWQRGEKWRTYKRNQKHFASKFGLFEYKMHL